MIGKTAIDEHLKKVKLLDEIKAWLSANDENLRKIILNLIRDKQLMNEGVDSEGFIIGTYSYITELLSEGRKKQGEPYNLNDTGDFFQSMVVDVAKDKLTINADYAKMEDKNWWNINILNLTDENLELYINNLKENYIRYTREILELN